MSWIDGERNSKITDNARKNQGEKAGFGGEKNNEEYQYKRYAGF